jgi:hypothetical protein
VKVQLYTTSKLFKADTHQLLHIVTHAHPRSSSGEPLVIDGPFTESKEWCAATAATTGASVEADTRIVERRSLRRAAAMPPSEARELCTPSSTQQSSFREEASADVDDVERMHEFLRSIAIDQCDGER